MNPPVIHDLPPMAPPVTVLGDVHLSAREPDVVAAFEAALSTLAGGGGTLVILGDLFDAWYGPPQALEAFSRRIVERIAEARAAGLAVVFMPGNRDFLVGPELGVEIWPDPVRTTWGKRRVVMTHGDLLCTSDRGYQAMRRVLRGPGGRPRWLTQAIPSSVRRRLATGLRSVSKRQVARKPKAIMDIDYGEAVRWLQVYEADVLVAGHVHTGVHHRLDGKDVLVLKDWERGGGVVRFDARGIRLVKPDVG